MEREHSIHPEREHSIHPEREHSIRTIKLRRIGAETI